MWQFVLKLNTCLPYDPAILLSRYFYSKEIKKYAHKNTHTIVFTAPSLVMVAKEKPPK